MIIFSRRRFQSWRIFSPDRLNGSHAQEQTSNSVLFVWEITQCVGGQCEFSFKPKNLFLTSGSVLEVYNFLVVSQSEILTFENKLSEGVGFFHSTGMRQMDCVCLCFHADLHWGKLSNWCVASKWRHPQFSGLNRAQCSQLECQLPPLSLPLPHHPELCLNPLVFNMWYAVLGPRRWRFQMWRTWLSVSESSALHTRRF